MKRAGNLIDNIADMHNLEWAFWKAQRGKKGKKEVIEFRRSLRQNLTNLQCQILSGQCRVGNYHFFMIHDPKERQICAAPFAERVLHHALMNVCHANFEQYQIFDSYATRVGKGTDAALKRAFYFQSKYRYFLKIDCQKYFDSIDHIVLKKLLFRRFKDAKLLQILYQIIDSYHATKGKGLPIGNLTSQYFANHYLAVADHYALEQLKADAMVRYMDDILIWGNSSVALQQVALDFEHFCQNKLLLNFKHCYQNTCVHGVNFLGLKLFSSHTELSSSSKKRLTASYQSLLRQSVEIEPQKYQKRLVSLFVRASKTQSYGFRKSLIHEI